MFCSVSRSEKKNSSAADCLQAETKQWVRVLIYFGPAVHPSNLGSRIPILKGKARRLKKEGLGLSKELRRQRAPAGAAGEPRKESASATHRYRRTYVPGHHEWLRHDRAPISSEPLAF